MLRQYSRQIFSRSSEILSSRFGPQIGRAGNRSASQAEVVPQVAARHEPGATIAVQRTVYLIEEVHILESLIPSFQL